MRAAPRRVLMTADSVGGVFSYAVELARALSPHGVEVALALLGPAPGLDQRELLRALPNVEPFVAPFKLEWMDDPWDGVRRAGDFLLRLQGRVRADCVHLNGYAHAALPFRVPALCVAHSCVLSWWEAVKHEPAPARYARYHREVACGIESADLVIAPSAAMLEAVRTHYGEPRRAQVIPNAIDASEWSPAPKSELVLSAGRVWDEAKNIDALAAIAPALPWPVAIAGDPGPGDTLGAALRLRPRPRWLGRLPRRALRRFVRSAGIYASPARYEPFGLGVLEAAHCGCALVLGDIASLRENWSGAAVFVDPDDPAALREALLALIGDPARRQQLAQAARRRAAQFTPQAMAAAYLDAYAQLGGAGSSRPLGSQPCAS